MSFIVVGLDPAAFEPLFSLDDAALAARGARRLTADAKPGFPCRVTLEDAEPGETVLLLHHESHSAPTPYRSAYAIYVRETANAAATYRDAAPPIFAGRAIALRVFDAGGDLIGADLALDGEARDLVLRAFEDPAAAYIHAHNAKAGCFAAEIRRA